jgi:hypothetical protein
MARLQVSLRSSAMLQAVLAAVRRRIPNAPAHFRLELKELLARRVCLGGERTTPLGAVAVALSHENGRVGLDPVMALGAIERERAAWGWERPDGLLRAVEPREANDSPKRIGEHLCLTVVIRGVANCLRLIDLAVGSFDG